MNRNNISNLGKKISFETIIVIAICLTVLLIGYMMSSRLNLVWLDEVAYTDPAANLYLGNGFTSSVLWHQTANEFFAGSTFLYPILLSIWMHIFGFSITAVRMLNFAMIVASAMMIWLSVIRLNLITLPWLRVALVTLILLGEGSTYIYINGRYDCTSLTLLAAAFLSFSVRTKITRYILLAIIGTLLPMNGLSLVVYTIIMMALLLLYNFKLFIKEFLFLSIGMMLGGIALLIIYKFNGVLRDYLRYSLGHFLIGENSNTNLVKRFFNFNKLSKLFNANEYTCSGCLRDKSFQNIFLISIILLAYRLVTRSFEFRSLLTFGITASICIPIAMCYAGIYPIYYSWMSYTPLAICTCSSVDQIINSGHIHAGKLLLVGIFVLLWLNSCAYGLPQSIQSSINNWEFRNYALVENLISNSVREKDLTYSDYSAFYAIKKRASQVFFPAHLKQIQPNEKNQISVIVIDPREQVRAPWNPGLEEVTNFLGGEWYDTGYSLGMEDGYGSDSYYKLKVFRRKEAN